MPRISLLQQHFAEERARRKPTTVQNAATIFITFGRMLTGQIKPRGHGGFLGLHAPMSYPVFFLIIFLATVVFLKLAFS